MIMPRNRSALIVAPHADDEVLGCGGTAMLMKSLGWSVHVLVLTVLDDDNRRGSRAVQREVVNKVANYIGFNSVQQLEYADVNSRVYRAQSLEMSGIPEIATSIRSAIKACRPSVVFCPHIGDLHIDHRIAAEAAHVACRLNWWGDKETVELLLAYETVGTTHRAPVMPFNVNLYVDMSSFLEKKLTAFAMYEGEVMPSPHARSLDAVQAQAQVRGSQVGVAAAEAFSQIIGLWQP